ncbi:MAG TPA: GH25 family lysozyme [Candidatus Angelobacter sp.]|jgi:lysozyme|nr:GH25 family lysozyme [Candidatus Angelobacter sp.]
MADRINVVVDISHHNGNVDLGAAKAGGIVGVIHKATQGTSFVDSQYTINKQKALAASLLWGAYHFGTGDDAVQQANRFLNTVQPASETLVVLDFEENPQGSSMTLEQARAFVTQVHDATGRWPGLYGGSYLKQKLGASQDPVLANCWLWYSRFGSEPVAPPTWTKWTMWQYTDGTNGPDPHDAPGIGPCDRDIFNGDLSQLQALWNASVLPPVVPPPATIIYRLTNPMMTGPTVVAIQQALSSAGFDPGPADGQFGPRTKAAVASFQTAQGLTADGEVGPQTAAALGVQL